MPYGIKLIKKPSGQRCSTGLSVFCVLVCPFGYCPSDSPRLTRNKAKALRNALLCGAYLCRNPFASTEAEGFSAFWELYTIPGRRWAEMRRICTSESNETCFGPSRSVRRVGRWLKICDHENLSPGSEVLFQRIIQDEARQYRSKVATLHLNSTRIYPINPNHLWAHAALGSGFLVSRAPR